MNKIAAPVSTLRADGTVVPKMPDCRYQLYRPTSALISVCSGIRTMSGGKLADEIERIEKMSDVDTYESTAVGRGRESNLALFLVDGVHRLIL